MGGVIGSRGPRSRQRCSAVSPQKEEFGLEKLFLTGVVRHLEMFLSIIQSPKRACLRIRPTNMLGILLDAARKQFTGSKDEFESPLAKTEHISKNNFGSVYM